jgi:hypothetical protein
MMPELSSRCHNGHFGAADHGTSKIPRVGRAMGMPPISRVVIWGGRITGRASGNKKITSNLIAVYQLASAVALALYLFQFDDPPSQIVYVLLAALNLVAGVGLWRDLRWAHVLSLANVAAQIPGINSSYFTYWYIGIGDIYPFVKIDPADATYLIGPSFYLYPGTFSIALGGAVQGVEIYVGLIATAFTVFNVRELRKRQQLRSLQQIADRFD